MPRSPFSGPSKRTTWSNLMKMTGMIAIACGLGSTATSSVAISAAPPGWAYSVVAQIPGTGRSWDYAIVDERAGRLYLAQEGVTALDLKTQKVTTGLVAGK